MLNSNLGFVLLFVTNPQKSAEFYQQIFGLKPVEISPTFAMFPLANGVMLGLWSKYTAEPQVTAPAGAMDIGFPVDDVDAMYDSLGAQQVTIVQKPTDMDFGRTFVLLDPDGHRIRVYKLHA
ncbi:MAG TPA: VOC family protein [Candidatus Babeliales bacterium]|nr:VOC family protein [Candidatus Babeliales bacterium]